MDKVDSYAAMRKYSTRRDADGIVRLELNNEALFQFGPLDQVLFQKCCFAAEKLHVKYNTIHLSRQQEKIGNSLEISAIFGFVQCFGAAVRIHFGAFSDQPGGPLCSTQCAVHGD